MKRKEIANTEISDETCLTVYDNNIYSLMSKQSYGNVDIVELTKEEAKILIEKLKEFGV